MPRKVCILGVHHAYQFQVVRPTYIQTVMELVQIHSVDLIAEESADHITTYVQAAVAAGRIPGVKWTNVDLSRDERKLLKDSNPLGIGTLQDFDFHQARERAWVERTTKAMKDSALLICGYCHLFSFAISLRQAGFEVETNVFSHKMDEPKP
jgi:hypothetical protein